MAEIRKYVAAFTNYHIHYAKVYLYTFIRSTLRTPYSKKDPENSYSK